jgi:hypothetical protein
MGEITTANSTTNWLSSIDASRQELIKAAQSGNKVFAAFAMADARASLIESLKDPIVTAKLLRITDPSLGMVELVNNPTDEDRVRWCAIAILSGFCPGDDQFAIFGAGKDRNGNTRPGKLYTKAPGFRTLFAHLGIVPEVSWGHPEFVPLGTGDKKVWQVSGKASCDYQGKSYEVCFEGDNRIGLPGYDSDNVAGIAAKAKRRLLQELWLKVSPILTAEHSDNGTDDVIPEAVVPRLEQPADKQPSAAESHAGDYDRCLKMLSSDPSAASVFQDIWKTIADVKTLEELDAIAKDSATLFRTFSKDVQGKIKAFSGDRRKELTEAAAS